MTPEQEQYLKWLDKELGMAISNEEGVRAYALIQSSEQSQGLKLGHEWSDITVKSWAPFKAPNFPSNTPSTK